MLSKRPYQLQQAPIDALVSNNSSVTGETSMKTCGEKAQRTMCRVSLSLPPPPPSLPESIVDGDRIVEPIGQKTEPLSSADEGVILPESLPVRVVGKGVEEANSFDREALLRS